MRRHGPCPADYQVTVYERELRPGGHSHTVTVDYDGAPIAVDTGFIVYNELNYPNFTSMLAHLGVETVASNMSFALSADNGRFEWKGGGGKFCRHAHRPVRAAVKSPVAVLPRHAARHPALQPDERCRSAQWPPVRPVARRVLRKHRLLGAAAHRLPCADGRRDLVDIGGRHAELPGREFRRVLRQSSPAALRPPGLAHRQGRQPELRRQAHAGIPPAPAARLRRHGDPPHGARRDHRRQPRSFGELRSRGDRRAQRRGAGAASGCEPAGARDPRRDPLCAERRLSASRSAADAAPQARLGLLEFPALAARRARPSTTSPSPTG